VFLNEYPEGGATSVVEAVGCGVPVVAMRAGERHAEAIGAYLVGPDAVRTPDRGAYWALVESWVTRPLTRSLSGQAQRLRAMELFDYPAVCRAYERAYAAVLASAGTRAA
jgi:glycosyltransferase involved in cell wall biosynthesis